MSSHEVKIKAPSAPTLNNECSTTIFPRMRAICDIFFRFAYYKSITTVQDEPPPTVSLPEEIWQNVASRLSLRDWARASGLCRTTWKLQLLDVVVKDDDNIGASGELQQLVLTSFNPRNTGHPLPKFSFRVYYSARHRGTCARPSLRHCRQLRANHRCTL